MISNLVVVDNVFLVIWNDEVSPDDIEEIYQKVKWTRAACAKKLVYIAFCGPRFKTPSTAGEARDAVFKYLPKVLEHCVSVTVVYSPKGGWIADIQRQGLRAMMAIARILRVEGVEKVYTATSIEDVLYGAHEHQGLERGLLTYADVMKATRDL